MRSVVVALLVLAATASAWAQPTSEMFGGLGIVVTQVDGWVTVVRVMPDTVAEQGGLRPFDRIMAIERDPTDAMELGEAVDRLRGRPGTPVVLWVARREPGGEWGAPHRVRLIRMLLRVVPEGDGPNIGP